MAKTPDMHKTPATIRTLKIFEFSKPKINIPLMMKTMKTPSTSGHGSATVEFRPLQEQ